MLTQECCSTIDMRCLPASLLSRISLQSPALHTLLSLRPLLIDFPIWSCYISPWAGQQSTVSARVNVETQILILILNNLNLWLLSSPPPQLPPRFFLFFN